MKKLFIILFVLLFAGAAFADVNVTVTWTQSVSSNAVNQKIFLDGVEKGEVATGQPSTFNFVETGISVLDMIGRELTVRTYSEQGAYADYTVAIGSISPATGMNILISDVD